MCCIFFSLSPSPSPSSSSSSSSYTLIVASNRDEFLSRSTAHASWHCFPSPSAFQPSPGCPSIAEPSSSTTTSSSPSSSHNTLCGIDAHPSGGGTWLGITRDGRWGALTNYTEAAPPMPPPASLQDGRYRSRGQLVKDWLNAPEGKRLEEYVDDVAKRRNEWPGFSVLLGEVGGKEEEEEEQQQQQKLAYITNRTRSRSGTAGDPLAAVAGDGMPGEVQWIVGGRGSSEASSSSSSSMQSGSAACSGGLSNSVLSEPWAKVKTGKERFEECVARSSNSSSSNGDAGSEEQLIEDLFETMGSAAGPVTNRAQMQASVLIPPLKLPFSSPAVPAVVEKESQLPSSSSGQAHGGGEKGGHQLNPAAPANAAAGSAAAAAALFAPAMSRGATPIGGRSANGKATAATAAAATTTTSAPAPRRTAWYATRTSTVILVRAGGGDVTFVERDVHVLDAEGEPTRKGCGRESERRFVFALGEGGEQLEGGGGGGVGVNGQKMQ